MLRVAKRARGAEAYYLEVAAGTGTGAEPAGRWGGAASGALGVAGPVDALALTRLWDGRHPLDGERLSLSHDRVRVAAFDLTFCAPKSVSLLQALGDGDVAAEVHRGHRRAVDAAVGYVERRAAAVRVRRAEGRVPEPVDGLAAATFDHHLSRALDPHLHSHVVVANLAAGPDGRWRALDARGVYAHRAAADALYHAELRHQLTTRLGVRWEPAHHGRADIAGIGPEVRQAFSQRAAAIAGELARAGRAGPRAEAMAALVTRPSRDPTVRPVDLTAWWRTRAVAAGLTPSVLDRTLDRAPTGVDRHPDEVSSSGVDRAVAALATGARAPARRHAVVAVAWSDGSVVPAEAIERAADRALDRVAHRQGRDLGGWRPGVAEPRVPLGPARERDPAEADRDLRLVARHLVARGLTPPSRHRGRGIDDGFGLG